MKLNKFKTLTIAAISATVLALGAALASAATCNVPADHATIQLAVDDPSCSEIDVAAGTYNENLIIPRAVILVGPNVNVDPNTGSRVAEAIINGGSLTAIQPQAPGIVINGFTVVTTTTGFPIYTGGTDITGLTVSYDIVGSGVRAITIATTPSNDLSILHNQITGSGYGIHFGNGIYGNVKINNNVVNGPTSFYAIYINGNGTVNGFELKDNKIHDTVNIAANTSNGTVSGNTFDAAAGSGLDMQIDLHNSTVTGNAFEGHNTALAGDNNACLQLFGTQFGLVPSDHVTVSNNTFNNCGAAGPSWTFAIQLSQGIHDIAITDNQISNSYDGVNTRTGTGWDVTGLEIHINYNNITGSARFGVNNTVSGSLDAECNWWNNPDGPGPVGPSLTGDKVSTNVDFTPWLLAPAPDGLCFGGTTTEKECHKFLEQQKKDFEEYLKNPRKQCEENKKACQQAAATPEAKKQCEADAKACRDNLEQQKKDFEEMQKAQREQCKDLPKH